MVEVGPLPALLLLADPVALGGLAVPCAEVLLVEECLLGAADAADGGACDCSGLT